MTVPLGELARQKALWAKIPDAGCRGLCVEACGICWRTIDEAENIAARGADQ